MLGPAAALMIPLGVIVSLVALGKWVGVVLAIVVLLLSLSFAGLYVQRAGSGNGEDH